MILPICFDDPSPSNAVWHGTDLEGDDAIKVIRVFSGDKIAKSIWRKLSGYSSRALVETAFARYKKMFGERAFFQNSREDNPRKSAKMNSSE